MSVEKKMKTDVMSVRKVINPDDLLKEIEVARLRLREAGEEADRYKVKFEKATENAFKREKELLHENEEIQNKLIETELNVKTLNQKCLMLEDQLVVEREKFFRQENELLEINKENRNHVNDERKARLELEAVLNDEKIEHDKLITDIDALQKKVVKLESENRTLENEISVNKSKYDKSLSIERDNKKQLRVEAQNDRLKAQEAADEIKENRALISELELKLDESVEAKAQAERELELAMSKLERLEHDFSQSQHFYTAEQNKIREESRNYQGLLHKSRHDLSELQVKYERLLRRLNKSKYEYRKDRTELLGEYKLLEREKAAVEFKLSETEKQMNVEKRVAGNQIDQLRAQMRNALSAAAREKQDLTRQLDVLLKDAEDVRRRAEGFDVEVDEIREAYDEQINDLKNENEKISNALQKTAHAFEDESRRNQKLDEQALSMRKLLEDLEMRMRDMQAENQSIIKAHKKKYENLSEEYENLKRMLRDVTEEKKRSDIKLDEAKERETSLRSTAKKLKNDIAEMRETVSASSASKAYLKEKYEAVESTLNELREALKDERQQKANAKEKLQLERESFTAVEKQLRASIIAEREQLESEHSREVGSYREEIDTLVKERDIARGDLTDERARNQELLKNLLTMREELELTQEASAAAKEFLKNKLSKAEEQLEEYRSEFLLEEQRRQELEKQLRELRRKMEFA